MSARGIAGGLGIVVLVIAQAAAAQQPQPSRSTTTAWMGGELSHGRIASGSTREEHVGLWIEVPASAASATRASMALSLVIDTSGSMSGRKIEHARAAALRFVETLRPGDIVSIYAFETTVIEIVPPTTMGPGVRESIATRIAGLVAHGNTNMHGGLMRAQQALATAPPTHRIRRVVLVSDGRATVQPTSSDALGQLAASGAQQHIAIAAIGVGADYDERSMRELAVRSAGRLYHVDGTEELSNAVTAELGLLDRSAATDARVELVAAPGVSITGVDTVGGRLENGRASFDIGTMYAPQSRELLIRVRAPATQMGRFPLAHAVLRYRDANGEGAERREDLIFSYEVTPDLVAASGSESSRVSALVALQASARSQLSAADDAGRGRRDQADARLARAESDVAQAASRTRDGATRQRLERERAAISRRREMIRAAPQPAAARTASRRLGSEALDAYGY